MAAYGGHISVLRITRYFFSIMDTNRTSGRLVTIFFKGKLRTQDVTVKSKEISHICKRPLSLILAISNGHIGYYTNQIRHNSDKDDMPNVLEVFHFKECQD